MKYAIVVALSVVLVGSILFLDSHLYGSSGPTQRSGKLYIVGSTSVLPLVQVSGEVWNSHQDDITVSVIGSGTGVGIKSISSGIADIAMASREVKSEEVEIYGDNFKKFPIAIDAICVSVSPDVYEGGVREISGHQLFAIYNGEIDSWGELGGPDETITVVAREVGSGTRDLFNEVVMGRVDHDTPGADSYRYSEAEVWATIASGRGVVGYLSLNRARDGEIRALAYEGVLPSAETVRDGSYPLARTLYMYTWGELDDDERAFLEFVTGEKGQAIAGEMGFVPVR
ncbi:phosphate ABC transporter substrate-binding protein [Methanotrichaceae archaeon M04Ac]|uniref:Phosphate ABC transporter substrate-binding protein n=1 Tax=Candidatus Methanocrinis alkalitolerans TaxID=3033395 RepID=A0ABT5XDT8_9EURY|nr:phosphate ABC transporter substrate-binding protein [Candidatus Methanocrinis alkalitolerans]MDF0592876.1 phosphate ABC transporter substrate-binding protein [Candidatus Methanocrinis alkalitolerans]